MRIKLIMLSLFALFLLSVVLWLWSGGETPPSLTDLSGENTHKITQKSSPRRGPRESMSPTQDRVPKREDSDTEVESRGQEDKSSKNKKTQARKHRSYENLDTFRNTGEGFEVPVEKKEGHEVAMGDILVPQASLRTSPGGDKAELNTPNLWSDGEVPYVIEEGLDVRDTVISSFQEFHQQTVVRFVPRQGEEDYLLIQAGEENCLSHVGRQGGAQPVILSSGCAKGQVLHEFMHALGFFHEQSRPDRDDYLTVYWGNIKKKYWPQFKRIPQDYFPPVDVEFDFQSILLYPPTAFAKDESYATLSRIDGKLYEVNRERLSPLDIEKINILYSSRR